MERREAEAEVGPGTIDIAPMDESLEKTQPDGSRDAGLKLQLREVMLLHDSNML